jgi:hypothetical protein
MAKPIEQLQQDAQEVLNAFAVLGAAASALDARLSEAASRIAGDRTAIQKAFSDLLAEVDVLQAEVTDFDAVVTNSIGSLEVSIQGIAQDMAQETGASAAAFAAVGQGFDAAVSQLQTVEGDLDTVIQDYQHSAGVRHSEIDASLIGMQQAADPAAGNVSEMGKSVAGLREGTAAVAQELDQFLADQRQQLEAWHDSFINEATEMVKDLVERIAQAGISQIREPIEKFTAGMQREVQAEANQLLERVLAGVEEGLRKIEDEIVQAAGGTQTKRQMMAPIREALDVAKEPINAVIDTVRSTAGIVGFGV